MVVTTIEVIVRYFFKIPMAETFEIVEYSLLWMGFLGAGWVLRREAHTRMDIVLLRLSPRVQAGLNAVTSVICAGMWLLLTYYGFKVTWDSYRTGYFLATLLAPPMWPVFIVIPLGGLLLFIQFVRRAISNAQDWRERGQKAVSEALEPEELRAY